MNARVHRLKVSGGMEVFPREGYGGRMNELGLSTVAQPQMSLVSHYRNVEGQPVEERRGLDRAFGPSVNSDLNYISQTDFNPMAVSLEEGEPCIEGNIGTIDL